MEFRKKMVLRDSDARAPVLKMSFLSKVDKVRFRK